VYLLTDALLEIQEQSYSKMLSTGLTKQSKKSCEKEAFLQEVMDDFEDGRKHVIDYVKQVSRKFLPDAHHKRH